MDTNTVACEPLSDNLPSLADFYEEPKASGLALGREVFEMFEHGVARALKFPKIRLRTGDGHTILMRRAGSRSRYPGQIQITDGRPFRESTYYGRIDCDGVLWPARAMTEQVRETLRRFAADPIGEARRYAWATGNCSYCGKKLTDVRSAAHGRGRRCSQNFGLPWNARRGLHGFWQDYIREFEPLGAA